MANRKYCTITTRPIIYLKDTNDEYVLDTNGDKIIVEDDYTKISSSDDYDVITTIAEFFE